ncbi:hypothetical protein FGF1_41060 [Flavobacteriaceae bacterium GF1]
MKIYVITLVMAVLFGCKGKETNRDNVQLVEKVEDSVVIAHEEKPLVETDTVKTTVEEPKAGFLFVDIGAIYNNGSFEILNSTKDTLIYFKNKTTYFDGRSYEMMNEDGYYKKLVNVEAIDPEYGLFIMVCKGLESGIYVVDFNEQTGYIDNQKHESLLTFKTSRQYVLEGYPNPTEANPLRANPSDDAEIIIGFTEHSYISVEIQGDWLKVKDDKDCYPGEEPSEQDIIGWVRWRKDGEIIIDIRHLC